MIYTKINKEAACKREAEAGGAAASAGAAAAAGGEDPDLLLRAPPPAASWLLWAGKTEEIGVLLAGVCLKSRSDAFNLLISAGKRGLSFTGNTGEPGLITAAATVYLYSGSNQKPPPPPRFPRALGRRTIISSDVLCANAVIDTSITSKGLNFLFNQALV